MEVLGLRQQQATSPIQTRNTAHRSTLKLRTLNADTIMFGKNELTPEQKLTRKRRIYEHAVKNGYAIPAYNINNMEQAKGVFKAAKDAKSPLIVQASEGAVKYAGVNYLVAMANVAKEEAGTDTPIMIHLDHGHTFEACKKFIDAGGDSVMIDGSKLPFEENVALTKQVVDYAHKNGVFVEAELGKLAGVEDTHDGGKKSLFTDPKEAKEFVKRTGCDSLAISIGTSHGHVKFGPDEKPELDFERLTEIKKAIAELADEPGVTEEQKEHYKNYPFVLHGASSSPKDLIDKSNQYLCVPRPLWDKMVDVSTGKALPDTITGEDVKDMEKHSKKVKGKGVPEEMYTQAASLGIAKVNVDSDFRASVFGSIKEFMSNNPTKTDPRGYFGAARDSITAIAVRKMGVLKSQGQAEAANKAANGESDDNKSKNTDSKKDVWGQFNVKA